MNQLNTLILLLDTSIFLCNNDRMTHRRVWTTMMCQTILANTHTSFMGFMSALQGVNINQPKIQLCIFLFREVLVPFQIKWDAILFKHGGKQRKWVRRKYRKELKLDFIEIQEEIRNLCGKLKDKTLDSEDRGIG